MKSLYLISAMLMLPTCLNAAEFTDVNLTKEQCDEWREMEYISLTKENKKLVEDSCKNRYSTENALGNCTAFEGEDLIAYLKKEAQLQCK